MKTSIKNSNKEHIIDVVLKYISEAGTHQITIREIARLAKVNSAAISYYFGSKDELIQEACMQYYDLGSKIFEELRDSNSEPKERLIRFFINYTSHMFKYPGFLKAQISEYTDKRDIRPEVEKWLKSNLKLLADTIGEASGVKDIEILYFKSIQYLSCLVYPFLLNKNGLVIGEWNFADEAIRKKYINILLDGML